MQGRKEVSLHGPAEKDLDGMCARELDGALLPIDRQVKSGASWWRYKAQPGSEGIMQASANIEWESV